MDFGANTGLGIRVGISARVRPEHEVRVGVMDRIIIRVGVSVKETELRVKVNMRVRITLEIRIALRF